MKQGNLPDDFPAKAALEAGEVTTFAQARKFVAGDDKIEGIGEATKQKIKEALEAVETDADTSGDAPDAPDGDGLTVKTEDELREEAKNPALKFAKDETNAERLAHSRFCFYDDPEGPFVALADDTVKRNERIKVTPISLMSPFKGLEVRDGDDHYVITEDQMAEVGNAGDWLKVRSPTTGLALIR